MGVESPMTALRSHREPGKCADRPRVAIFGAALQSVFESQKADLFVFSPDQTEQFCVGFPQVFSEKITSKKSSGSRNENRTRSDAGFNAFQLSWKIIAQFGIAQHQSELFGIVPICGFPFQKTCDAGDCRMLEESDFEIVTGSELGNAF